MDVAGARSGARTRGVRIIPDRLRPARGHGFLAHPTGSTPSLARDNTAPGPSSLAQRQPPAPLTFRPARTVSLGTAAAWGNPPWGPGAGTTPRPSAPPTRSAAQSRSAVGCQAIRARPEHRGPRRNGSPQGDRLTLHPGPGLFSPRLLSAQPQLFLLRSRRHRARLPLSALDF